ncbi:unnamed protein product [Caenorhabditis brenneri]
MDETTIKEEEIDYDEIVSGLFPPTEVASTSRTPPIQPLKSRKRKPKSELRDALDRSIKKGDLDILQAGLAIQKAYETSQTGISNEISSFLTETIPNVPFPQMPESLDSNPTISLAMMHGYGLAAQMALAAANRSSKIVLSTTPPKDFFNCVSDNFDCVKSEFNYPSTAPFSGKPIEMNLVPVMESNAPAHVRLQNYLFHLLGKACTKQTDIQRFWVIPGEKNYHLGNSNIFPRELFDNLKQIFLEFFRLNYDEFDLTEYEEKFSQLPHLRHLVVPEAKKQMFENLVAAKKVFKNSIFLLGFKAAMKELRHATFVNIEGTSGGYFTKRQRHLPKSLLYKDKVAETSEIKTEMEHPDFENSS